MLVCPAAMVTAFAHCEPGTRLQVDNQEAKYWIVNFYPTVFNYTGHPVMVMPYKRDEAGLPLGIQWVHSGLGAKFQPKLVNYSQC